MVGFISSLVELGAKFVLFHWDVALCLIVVNRPCVIVLAHRSLLALHFHD